MTVHNFPRHRQLPSPLAGEGPGERAPQPAPLATSKRGLPVATRADGRPAWFAAPPRHRERIPMAAWSAAHHNPRPTRWQRLLAWLAIGAGQ